MSIRHGSRYWGSGLILLMGAVTADMSAAQPAGAVAPNGAYVFSESGPAFTSLAQLTFAADGTVTGLEVLRSANNVSTYNLQGAYSAVDQVVTVTLNATSVDAVDASGDPLVFTERFEMIGSGGAEFATLRTDSGMYGTGSMTPAGTAIARGVYLLNGKPIDPAAVTVEALTLDGAGNVSGRELLDAFGVTNVLSLSGSYAAQPNGFQNLTVVGEAADSDGNVVSTSEIYVMLPTRKDVRLMRIDNGPSGILVMSQ